jgi:DNA-binding response OmpR family regulator
MTLPLVLIVDDDKLTRWSVSRVLTRAGYRVHEAATASEGLAAVARNAPDAILLDIMLPDGDGFTALQTIHEARPALPVILITAHGSEETARRARDLGARGHLVKPCNPEGLCATLALALDPSTPPEPPSQ